MAIALKKKTALRSEELPSDCGVREKELEPVPDSGSKPSHRARANGVRKGTSRRVTTKIWWWNDTSFGGSALVVVSHRDLDLDLVPWLLWAPRLLRTDGQLGHSGRSGSRPC